MTRVWVVEVEDRSGNIKLLAYRTRADARFWREIYGPGVAGPKKYEFPA